mmetsp:Transcript_22537/g.47319  ORF Transcript_22537/g.47319 Transcript_22537/m.47319 type:complete len:122 (-) Transcript_22537:76-441(-)
MPWPEHPKFLQPNKNDTWNDYQKLHRGKIVTTSAWREARDALHRDFREYLSRGGIAQVQASDLEEMERGAANARAVLTHSQAMEIFNFKSAARGSRMCSALARAYGVTPKAIRDIWKGRTW